MTQPQPAATTSSNASQTLRPPKVMPAKHATVHRSANAKATHAMKRAK